MTVIGRRQLPIRTRRRGDLAAAARAYAQFYARSGGLISYANDVEPSELPVQGPTKFLLSINLKTARALGLTVSPTLLVLATEVIELGGRN
jgi:putative tryptophan/tyrosine transport system substrate-binding protein